MITCSIALSIATSLPGLKLQRMAGVAHQVLAARIHDDQLRAALGSLLEIGGGDRDGSGSALRRSR
jgi:hypothetical protein